MYNACMHVLFYQTVKSAPTLLHCAAHSNQSHVVDYLRQISYPPTTRCKRVIDEDRNVSILFCCVFVQLTCEQYTFDKHRLVVMNLLKR